MTKAIFFDIDGTILDREHGIAQITPRVASAMKKLQAAGDKIFIATGRPVSFIYGELLNFGFDGFVTSNGALVLVGGKVIFESELDMDGVKKICAKADAENIEYILQSYPNTYLRKNFTVCENFCKQIGVDYSNFVRDFDLDKIKISKMECMTARRDLENLDVIYKEMIATPGFTGWSDPFHYKTMEIYSDKVSKATGILKMLEYFKIPVENSFAFGDGRNDGEMIKTVGTGLVMGTARDELKKVGKYVVPGVQDDGVAVGIENYILGD
ncbi:MAG: HAD family phosphatase [Selenomonadaceae bacterium]|nr:HAD family phosphatase [Selenomonadaceae bacterium]